MYAQPLSSRREDVAQLRREAGAWLKNLREKRNISQRELARQINIDYYTFISQIEAGRGRIPPERYEAWARALDVDVRRFTRKMMSFYDPVTYAILFQERGTEEQDS